MNNKGFEMPDEFVSLEEVLLFAEDTLKNYPERDISEARRCALQGKNRRFPVINIGYLVTKEDQANAIPENIPRLSINDKTEKKIAEEIISMLQPLKLLNPIQLTFSLGLGPGTLIPCFGVPLDPECDNTPAYTISMDDVIAEPLPDPATTGLFPEMCERVKMLKEYTPVSFKIAMPDYQGPFNIAHSLVGEEVMLAPYTAPDKFRTFMEKITDFWIKAVQTLKEIIGAERMTEIDKVVRISECSVNLISKEMYEEFILPYDLKIRETLGPVGIHTCSGPHVFRATLENIPDIVYTEAGYIERTAAGFTPVDMAMEAIKGKPILLNIGQELHNENHFETIRNHLDLYRQHNRLLFSYTAMRLGYKDGPYIRDLHRRLDDYRETNG